MVRTIWLVNAQKRTMWLVDADITHDVIGGCAYYALCDWWMRILRTMWLVDADITHYVIGAGAASDIYLLHRVAIAHFAGNVPRHLETS